jgi:hypothetical protein
MCRTRSLCSRKVDFKGTTENAIFPVKKGKGKGVPLEAWSDPEGSRKLRFPDYMTTVQDCGQVSLMH